MSENYEELLDQTVEEVKDAVKDLEEPDYEEILEAEKDGQDRKTIKNFIQEQIDVSEEAVEETAEEIEEETAGGVLGGFDREKILIGGVIAGLVIGLVLGFAFNMQDSASQAEVRDSIQQFYDASGTSPDSLTVTESNGMYYATVNMSQETENGTETSSQGFYVSPDGELLFPEVQSPFLTNPYRINDLIAQAQQQQQQPSANTTQ